jgi:ElaB/YqjD/DUF883 family membrane-anchored ribosome-binding protein
MCNHMERRVIKENMEEMDKRFSDILDRAERTYRDIRKEAQRARDNAEWYIRSNPRKATLMSIGAGVVMGVFLSTFMRRRR